MSNQPKEQTMKQLKLLGAALMAVLCVSAVASSMAFAVKPGVLPTPTAAKPVTGESKSGVSTFGSGFTTITSAKSEDKEEFTTEDLGSFKVIFKESKDLLSRKCTGLKDATEGNITVEGAINLRYALNKNKELIVVALFLLPAGGVHFSCGGTLAVVTGCAAGIVTPTNKLSATSTVDLKKSGNDNEIITVLKLEKAENENCELKAAQNEGTPELAAFETKQELFGFKQGGVGISIEVMA
jgi:phosphotransferase system HPr-like phosphotransfer protein